MSNKNIKKLSNKSDIIDCQWEEKIRYEFEESTNTENAKDFSYKIFSMDDQINRYSKALAFWNIKLYNNNSLKEIYMFQSSRNETYIRIHTIFSIPDQQKIIEKANELARIFKK